MGHDIYYFTGTGNSLAVARQLAEKTGARLLPVSKTVSTETVTGATIGIVFPIYMYNAPLIVYDFLKKIQSCEYLYIVMTMGGESGKTARRIISLVKTNGLRVDAAFSLQMPDNYIVWFDAADETRQQQIFSAAQSRINEMAAIITTRKHHIDDEHTCINRDLFTSAPFPFSILPSPVSQALYDMGLKFIHRMDSSFNLNGKCVGCGICSKICPVGNISMTDGRPEWLHKCEQCLACLQWCPHEAIEYGKKTIGRKRYTHPDVTIREMMQ